LPRREKSRHSRRNRELKLLLGAIFVSWVAFFAVYIVRPKISLAFAVGAALLFGLLYVLAHVIIRIYAPHSDPMVLPLISLLTGLGLIMIYRLSLRLAIFQFVWITVGILALTALLTLLKDYRVLEKYKYSLGLIGLLLLVSTLRFGGGLFEPNLWLKIGPLNFQPSEIAKILIVIFFAAYLQEKRELLSTFTKKVGGVFVPEMKHLGPLLAFWAISLGLLIIQKDLGASLLFFGLFLGMLYIATERGTYVGIGALLFLTGATAASRIFVHVGARVQTWLNPWQDMAGRSFQLVQSLFAIASGGVWGSGLGRGFPTLIPAVATDFIFSAFSEEIGLLGVVGLIALYLVVVARGFKISLKTADEFGKLLVAGLTTVFALQTFIIIGGVTRVVPLTGITLPFMSYGGSSILANFILMALLIAVSHQSIKEASEVK
jgi:cell division protein FtsW (lipid II flippase)